MTTIITTEVDEEISTKILQESGLTVSDVIRITLSRIVQEGDYILTPNDTTAETIRKAEAGVDIYSAKDIKEFREQLGIKPQAFQNLIGS
ncbi:MAG: type II toxin-antitoxin system RelB/DinJ family antitoxin [Deferribacteraceae bacterium]|jgi:antitoxin component of RelBE/YafQ-DinJ toxin-antitoxin module|nr:type II toxin-antitoxin system RelB/DinJ family antitoxin [Deferribacteraceae bacterium]